MDIHEKVSLLQELVACCDAISTWCYDAKGELLFDTLREGLGERRFFAGLRRYYADYAGKLAAPEDLAASFRNKGAEEIIAAFREGKAVI